ncbi:class I SAM-dependent methyltransferase [Azospirillum thermophilum]|uniref:Class I SAM-dependent methyltransferase n=1 Tax=Azospirillum thermophilum TaxID=2202148 RepID=A0A2S2D0G1_9PROT|nr:methyltransferase domain-containing protein [Azospirillum thermophilum]AWK90253.1 hypothetical protein DEW08_30040 [Azospirillum thermophilum]
MLSKLLAQHIGVNVAKMRAPNFLERQDEMERAKVARIERGAGWRSVESCPLCGGAAATHVLTKRGSDMVACTGCGLYYHRRIPADLGDVYDTGAYEVYSRPEDDEHFTYRKERFGRERVAILERHGGPLAGRRLLDIGCGAGWFLAAALEAGALAFGTDYSIANRTEAARRTGVPIFDQNLDRLPERDFDIVTLFDVIEHVPEPLPFLRQVDRLLRPGGLLLVYTPNADSFAVRAAGPLASIIDPTEHILLFTLDSLRHLGDRMGYELPYLETRGLDVAGCLALPDLAESVDGGFLVRHADALQAMIDAAGCGNYARVLYRKRP